MSLIENDLSEPYSIFTYRYFLLNWPSYCFLAYLNEGDEKDVCVGVIICRLQPHNGRMRGYIAMLAVDKQYRNRKIGVTLVRTACLAMKENNADEVVLETEYTNKAALALYDSIGFIRDKRLARYYLNGADAFRLKLYLK
ncbi:N-alpha-acetyltransferase 30 [Nowakowskiella sp. JEL0407]|nr:N-alpha-acetyltransferase 30 [Nowakowskiella sp. JEL0407]